MNKTIVTSPLFDAATEEAKRLAAADPIFCTVTEATKRLRISRQTLYDYIRSGDLPSALLGRKRLLRVTDVHEFADRMTTSDFQGIDNNQSKAGAS